MLADVITLFAKAGGEVPPPAGGNALLQFAPLVIIMILFYFFLIRGPMKRQEQERNSLLSNLKKNDEVVTTGGIIGLIASMEEGKEEVILKLDESSNVRVRVLKGNIVRNLSREKQAREEKKAAAGQAG